jgi:hypothetical protein
MRLILCQCLSVIKLHFDISSSTFQNVHHLALGFDHSKEQEEEVEVDLVG